MGIYSNMYQGGSIPVFFSGGSNPFTQWETHVKDGRISRVMDPDLKTYVTDIRSSNVSTTYMICPKGNQSLGITLPFLVMIVKNLKKYFAFEVAIRDDTGAKRRFRIANFQSSTRVEITSTVMPIGLTDGWNQIQFNLSDFTRKAYNRSLAEVVSVKINANIRLRIIYFTAKLLPEDQLPKEYRLFYPLQSKSKGKQSKEPKELAVKETTPPGNVVETIKQNEMAQEKPNDDSNADDHLKQVSAKISQELSVEQPLVELASDMELGAEKEGEKQIGEEKQEAEEGSQGAEQPVEIMQEDEQGPGENVQEGEQGPEESVRKDEQVAEETVEKTLAEEQEFDVTEQNALEDEQGAD